jgi:hypothetical protein
MSDTIVWISGATDGVRSGLVKTVPWRGARIINLSRRGHPDFETIKFDLTRPETYDAVKESFRKKLTGFKGKRAIFFITPFTSGRACSDLFPKWIRRITAVASRPMRRRGLQCREGRGGNVGSHRQVETGSPSPRRS